MSIRNNLRYVNKQYVMAEFKCLCQSVYILWHSGRKPLAFSLYGNSILNHNMETSSFLTTYRVSSMKIANKFGGKEKR
jgi:hypothetical protein